MIKHENGKYVLYSRDGKRKLFSSPSYQACLEREKQINYFKTKQKEKK